MPHGCCLVTGDVLSNALHLLPAGRSMIIMDGGCLYLSFCCLSASSRFLRAAALAACFSVPSMIFSVTKSRPAEVEGLQDPFAVIRSWKPQDTLNLPIHVKHIQTQVGDLSMIRQSSGWASGNTAGFNADWPTYVLLEHQLYVL